MDEQTVNFPSTSVNEKSNEIIPPQIPDPQTTSNKNLIPIAAVGLLIVTSLAAAFYFQQHTLLTARDVQPTATASPVVPSGTDIPSVTVSDAVSFPLDNIVDSQKRLLFLRKPDPDQHANIQAWLMLPNGSQSARLNIPDLASAFKQPDSSLVFYTTFDDQDTIFARNLNTDQVSTVKPLVHPSAEVNVGLSLEGLESISPDGRYLIFSTFFTMDCPVTVDEPQPQGPCQPEADPNLPDGQYLYDLAQNTRTPLPDSRVATWDMTNQKLYIISNRYQANGLEVIDLQTKRILRFDNADSFGYAAYPLIRTNKLARFSGSTENEGASVSRFSILDRTTHHETVVDSGRWADIQPFAAISPDEKFVLYERRVLSNGMAAARLYRYNLQTAEKQMITPETVTESYGIRGVWLDDNTYVTMVSTIEEPFYNGNNFLVKIDVPTGQITRLTPDDDVYRFSDR